MSQAKSRSTASLPDNNLVTITLPQEQVLSLLKTLAPAISTDEFAEAGPRICFYNDHLLASSSNLLIRIPFKAAVVPGLVSYTDLRAAIEHANDTISFTLGKAQSPNWEHPQIVVDSTNSEDKKRNSALRVELPYLLLQNALRFQSVLETLKMSDVEEDTFTTLPDDFQDGVELCLGSATKVDKGVPYVNVINAHKDLIWSTDKTRASQYKLTSSLATGFQLPVDVAEKLVKMPHLSGYKLSQGWIQFIAAEPVKTGGRPIYAIRRPVEVKFPDLAPILDTAQMNKLVLPVEKLLEPLQLLSHFTKGQTQSEWNTNIIDIRNKRLSIRSGTGGRQVRYVIESAEMEISERYRISILPDFLLAALDGADTMYLPPKGSPERWVVVTGAKFTQAIILGVLSKDESQSE